MKVDHTELSQSLSTPHVEVAALELVATSAFELQVLALVDVVAEDKSSDTKVLGAVSGPWRPDQGLPHHVIGPHYPSEEGVFFRGHIPDQGRPGFFGDVQTGEVHRHLGIDAFLDMKVHGSVALFQLGLLNDLDSEAAALDTLSVLVVTHHHVSLPVDVHVAAGHDADPEIVEPQLVSGLLDQVTVRDKDDVATSRFSPKVLLDDGAVDANSPGSHVETQRLAPSTGSRSIFEEVGDRLLLVQFWSGIRLPRGILLCRKFLGRLTAQHAAFKEAMFHYIPDRPLRLALTLKPLAPANLIGRDDCTIRRHIPMKAPRPEAAVGRRASAVTLGG
mmetsp:Transcript_40745/g.89049  ORF Transcript_40745/g.89049 Transcript_40745/m.89049 type:complete len:332 (+) Transcript_40745:798-1793(+)